MSDYWAGSPHVLRIRVRLARARAEYAATDQQMEAIYQQWPAGNFGWAAVPEWKATVRVLRKNYDAMRELEKTLSAATESCESREFYNEPVRYSLPPRRAVVRNYMKTGRTVMIDGVRVPLVEFVR